MDNDNNIKPEGLENSASAAQAGSTQPDAAEQTGSSGYQQYQTQPYYYAQYQQPVKKKNAGVKVLAALLIIMSLAVGGLLTAYVIMPAIDRSAGADETLQDEDVIMVDSQKEQNADVDDLPALEQQETQEDTEQPDESSAQAETDQSENPIVWIAKEVSPSVVGVTVSVDSQGIGQSSSQDSGYGTGIIISEDGYIATNNHVVDGSDSVRVTLIDGTEYDAEIIGTDPTTDLAVLKIEAQGLSPVVFGDSDAIEVGETVVAIGNPLGSDLAGSVTSGIISAKDRLITTSGYTQKYIQTDAAINPGNSGGPLVNIEGEVIGINTLKTYLAGYDDYGVPIGTEGIGFAIPADTAFPVIEQLMETGSVERPGIGISCLVDSTNAYNPEGSPEGVTVAEVVENSPAAEANLMVGDIITSLDGVEITTVEELVEEIQKHNIGEEIEMTVWRDGQEYRTMITIGDLNNMG